MEEDKTMGPQAVTEPTTSVEPQKEFISPQDLAAINDKKAKNQITLLLAQKAAVESQAIDLEYRNEILRTFIKYSLSKDDTFSESTGEITRQSKKDTNNG